MWRQSNLKTINFCLYGLLLSVLFSTNSFVMAAQTCEETEEAKPANCSWEGSPPNCKVVCPPSLSGARPSGSGSKVQKFEASKPRVK